MRKQTTEQRIEKLEVYVRHQRKRAWMDFAPKQYTTLVTSHLTLCDGAIVGDQDGLTVISKWIASDNFSSGASGWSIDGNGSAEFNNVTVRGTVYATAGEVGGWTIGVATITGGNATLHSSGYLSLGTGNDLVRVDATDATYRLWIGNATAASAPFRVTKAGALIATAATITGTITATSGAIGGWTVNVDNIAGGSATLHSTGYLALGTGNDYARLDAANATYRLWIGHATAGTAPFRVTKGGGLTATDAAITGTITATAGEVGGWTINADNITGGDAALHSSGYLSLGTGNNLVRVDAADATYRLWAGHATAGSAPFRVTKTGAVTATAATITGTVTASAGAIGGWAISVDNIAGGDAVLHSSGYLGLGTGNDYVRLDAANATYRLWVGHATAGSAPFRVTKAGALTATSATITGAITATSGEVGGWTINADNITGGNAVLHSSGYLNLGTGNDLVRVDAADATYRLWVGHATAGSAPFRVTKAGVVTATSATITGTITATAGAIGGWAVNADNITGGNAVLHSSGYLNLGTGNDLVRVDAANATHRLWVGHATAGSAPFRVTKGGAVTATNATVTGTIDANAGHIGTLDIDGVLTVGSAPCIQLDGPNKRIESTNFASGVSGFRIDHTGEAEFNNVVVRGGLHTAVFVHDEVHVQAGRLLVSPNAGTLGATLTTAATGSFNTGEAGRFAANDIVRLKDGTSDAWLTVTADNANGTYNYSLSSGAAGQAFTAGTAVASYGASGEGCLLLDASSAHAPFLDIFTHAGAPWTTQTLKVRIGNLAGVTDADLSPSGYGLYTDNVFLKGKIISIAGEIGGWTLAAASLTGGNATLHSDGYLGLGTGNDYARLDAADATYRLWIGHTTAGSAPFRVTKGGALTAVSGTVGGWTLGASDLTGGSVVLSNSGNIRVGTLNDIAVLAADDANYRLWIGNATAGSAPFRVTKAGALTAISGTVGGWTLAATTLSAGACVFHSDGYMTLGTGNDIVTIDGSGAVYRFWVGHAVSSSAPFRVTKAGALTATSATITGTVTATGGDIGTLGVSGTLTLGAAGKMLWTGGKLTVDGIDFVEGTSNTNFVRWRLVNTEGTVCGRISSDWGGTGTDPVALWLTSTIGTGESPYYAITVMKAEDIDASYDARWQVDSWAAGRARFLSGGAEKVTLDAAGDIRALGGLVLGSIGENPDAGDLEMSGGLIVGSVAQNPGVGEVLVTKGIGVGAADFHPAQGCVTMTGGLWVGSNSTTPNDGCLYLEGTINKSTSISCVVYRSTKQLIPNSSYTAISYNVQVTDTHNLFAPTSSRMYATRAGFYIFGASIFWDAIVAAQSHIITARKNGSIYLTQQGHTAAASHANRASVTSGSYMAVNDYIEILIYQTSGASRNIRGANTTNMRFNSAWMTRVA